MSTLRASTEVHASAGGVLRQAGFWRSQKGTPLLSTGCAPGDARRDDFGGGRERRRGYGFGESGYDDERGGGGGFGRDRSRGGGGFADSYGRERSSGGSFADSYGRDRERGGRDAPEAGGRGYGFRCGLRRVHIAVCCLAACTRSAWAARTFTCRAALRRFPSPMSC